MIHFAEQSKAQHSATDNGTVQRSTADLEGGDSSSLVLAGQVLLQNSHRHLVSPQVADDQLNMHPELAEHNGLCELPSLLPRSLHNNMVQHCLSYTITQRFDVMSALA